MNDESVSWRTSLDVTERLASSDVQLVLVKDGEHRMSRAQDLEKLVDMLAGLISDIRKNIS
jgi:hypothetical protein